jgi:phage-related protein
MESLVDAIVYAIQRIFESILKNLPKIIKAIVKIIWYLIKAVVKAIISCIKDTDWKGVWNAIKDWFGEIWSKIKGWFSSLWDTVKGWFENIGNHIKNFFGAIGDWFKSFFGKIKEWVSSAWDGIKSFFSAIGDWFKDIWDTVVGWVGKIGDKMGEFFGLFSKENKSTGSHVAKGILGVLTGGISNIFTGFATGTENAPSGLAVVGEEGPELVNFRGGEQVIPAPQTKQILQSGNARTGHNRRRVASGTCRGQIRRRSQAQGTHGARLLPCRQGQFPQRPPDVLFRIRPRRRQSFQTQGA